AGAASAGRGGPGGRGRSAGGAEGERDAGPARPGRPGAEGGMSQRLRGEAAGGSRSEQWTALLVTARDGDESAFDRLHDEARPALFRRAQQRLNDASLADDVVSQTFQRVWEHRARYDPAQSNASTWLYRILEQRVTDALKKARTGAREVLGFEGTTA